MSLAEIIAVAAEQINEALSSRAQIVALVSAVIAAALIVAGSFLKTMIPLRWLAVGSNIAFLVYGVLHPSLPMLLLHGTLLPINIYRAVEMISLTRRVRASAASKDRSGFWLKPYMKRTRRKAGDVLFHKGDPADHLYFLAEGRIELVEIGQMLEPGRIFGEIAFFAPEKRRTLTARCAQDCTVLTIDESNVRQLYYQNPEFGYELVALVAGRLSADVQRLEQRLADSEMGELTRTQ